MPATITAPSYRVGVDIGGTFTDVVVATSDGGRGVRKLLSTPPDFGRAVIAGVRAALADLGAEAGARSEVVHATTVVTNAILERKGARCAVITTEGFRDVLEIGRLRMPELFNLFYDKPPKLVPRRRVFEVRERMDHHGEVLVPLDQDSVEAAVEAVLAAGVDAVAVCLINSYANPAHERAVAETLAIRAPGLDVSVSSEILPRIGEYERTSTTVLNAYVRPAVRRYLDAMVAQLKAQDIDGPLYIMQCSGGLTSAERAAREPVTLVESGPAAGVLAGRELAQALGYANALTFDMGGTTAKAAIIEAGALALSGEYEVGGRIAAHTRLTGGGGFPIGFPVVDVAEVGAGGGSLAWIDAGGGLRVGPHSAGAQPGPACYAQGGEAPTVTDANVVLGYLNPEAIAGGEIAIRRDLAERVVMEQVARPLGIEPLAAAHGIHLIANSAMMGAIRAVSTQRGRDVRDFVLIAFGGSGPVHAVGLARAMGIGTVVVPAAPGLFSAVGLLATDLEFQQSRVLYADLGELGLDELNAVLGELHDEVWRMAAREEGQGVGYEIAAELRYWGQSYELTVTAPFGPQSDETVAELIARFERQHERTYGHRAMGERVILVALRVIARLRPAMAAGTARAVAGTPAAAWTTESGERRVYFGPETGSLATPVIARAELSAEAHWGPLLIEEYDSVTVVPPECSACLHPAGHIIVTLGAGSAAPASATQGRLE